MKHDNKLHGYPINEHKPPEQEADMLKFPYDDDLFFPYYTENMRFDPEGSYTGVPVKGDQPVQDADDL